MLWMSLFVWFCSSLHLCSFWVCCCHDVALFGYREHPPLLSAPSPSLSLSYTQAAVRQVINSWRRFFLMARQYRERVRFHRENKGTSSTSQNLRTVRWKKFLCSLYENSLSLSILSGHEEESPPGIYDLPNSSLGVGQRERGGWCSLYPTRATS